MGYQLHNLPINITTTGLEHLLTINLSIVVKKEKMKKNETKEEEKEKKRRGRRQFHLDMGFKKIYQYRLSRVKWARCGQPIVEIATPQYCPLVAQDGYMKAASGSDKLS